MTITASLVLTACSSYHPRSPTPTPFPKGNVQLEQEGSVLVDYVVTYPTAWMLEERRGGDVAVLTPPAGKGTLRIVAFLDRKPPTQLSRAYAVAVAGKALFSVGLQANVRAVRRVTGGHFIVISSGVGLGTAVHELVHVFDTGKVVVAFFRAPARDNHFATAQRIMKSLRPKEDT